MQFEEKISAENSAEIFRSSEKKKLTLFSVSFGL